MIRSTLPALLLLAAIATPSPAFAKADMTGAVPQTRALYLQFIRQARLDGRARAAIAYLDDFDQRYPGDFEARLLRINSLLDLGQIEPAQAVLTQLDTGKTGEQQAAALLAVRGHLFSAREKWAEAATCYQQAVDRNPTDPALRNDLGYALLRQGATDRAIETLRNASDLAPSDLTIRNNLILAFVIGGQPVAMASALERVSDGRTRAELRRQVLAEAQRVGHGTPAATATPKGDVAR